MGFVTIDDFKHVIQSSDLDVILGDDDSNINQSLFAALSEVKGFIRNRYDVDRIFKTTNIFSFTATYAVDDLVEQHATAYAVATTYAVGNYVSYESDLYKCILIATGKVPTNQTYWTKTGKDRGLYKCILEATGQEVSNTTYFEPAEDPQLLKTYVIDIALYIAHSRIQPRNIPEWREQRRDNAIEYLIKVSKGKDITMNLPIYSDTDIGQRISYGGNDRQVNIY